jgi:hypothetical protein
LLQPDNWNPQPAEAFGRSGVFQVCFHILKAWVDKSGKGEGTKMTKSISILITTMIFWSAATITSVYAFDLKLRLDSNQIGCSDENQEMSAMEIWRAKAR